MVIRAGPHPRRQALTTVRHRPLGPWWLWAAMVFLLGIGSYAAYLAKTSGEGLKGAQAALIDLSADRDRLEAKVAELTHSMEQASRARDEAEVALKQSRADADAAVALGRELQKRLTGAQSEADAARGTAAASKKDAERLAAEAGRANAAFTQVRNLQERVSALKSEADSAREAKAALEREVVALKKEIAELRQKLEAGATASTRP